ncbi:MAG: helix-turn-helix domain-containing protein [Saprospiraceae bacterium]|nr:helix-turn-helix domain-containing protein [Saprospiraceae bacterium]
MTDYTIAVLPFVNISADPDNEYFSDGITEEIINALAGIENLRVISRTSSFYFKNKKIALRDIARQLKAGIILEGSVRIAHGMVRIATQLIHADEDVQYWSNSWDRKMENIFEIQDEISVLIAEKIREHFGHFEISDHLVTRQTTSVDAYNYALKAKFHFNKWNPEDVSTAIDLFKKAITLDKNHAESYLGLADAYGFMATTQFMPMQEAWTKASEYTHQAFTLDPENAGVHYQLANLSFFTEADFSAATTHTLKSLQLKPSYPEAQQFMGFLYILSGDMDKARTHLQFALAIDPLNEETLFYQAYYLYRSRRFSEALINLDDRLKKNSKNIPAITIKIYCHLMLQQYEVVLQFLGQLTEDLVIAQEKQGIECLAHILMGNKITAREGLVKLEAEAKNPYSFQAHSYLFLAYLNLDRVDDAFQWLNKAFDLRSAILLLTFSDPLAKNVTTHSDYAVFHKKLYGNTSENQVLQKKKTALLEPAIASHLQQKVFSYIKSDKPYLNPNLSLRSLAEQTEIHPNQLSWLLNEQIGKNYNEFINEYRVEHFKDLALNPENTHISLIGLAFESGFNSKTVFNTFFKKHAGMTPSQFVRKHRSKA